MNRRSKMLLSTGAALVVTGGAIVNFLVARQAPLTPQEELTLANIEALAIDLEGLDIDYDVTLEDGTQGSCWGVGNCFEDHGVTFPGEWIPRV